MLYREYMYMNNCKEQYYEKNIQLKKTFFMCIVMYM